MTLLKQIELTKQEFKQAYAAKTPTSRKNFKVAHAWLAQFPLISLCYAIIILILGLCVGFDLAGHSANKPMWLLSQKIFQAICVIASIYLALRSYHGLTRDTK